MPRPADPEQTGITLITPAWSTAKIRLAPQLLVTDKGKRRTELLVLDDRGLRDLADLVEGPIRQFDADLAAYVALSPRRGCWPVVHIPM